MIEKPADDKLIKQLFGLFKQLISLHQKGIVLPFIIPEFIINIKQ